MKYASISPQDRKDYVSMGFDTIYGYISYIPTNVKSFEMLLDCVKAGFADSWDSDNLLELPTMKWKEMAAKRFTFGLWIGSEIQYIEVSRSQGVSRVLQLIDSGTLLETVHSVKLGGVGG